MSVVKVTRSKVKLEPETEAASSSQASACVTPARKKVKTEDDKPSLNPWVDQDDKYRDARAKIFEMCSIGNWKEFRLVCKSWNDEITPILYSTVEFDIGQYQKNLIEINTGDYQVGFPWKLSAIPFQRYKMEDLEVGETGWTRMWHDLGHRMKSLKISSTVVIHNVDFIGNVLFASTPNLEVLKFYAKIEMDGTKETCLVILDDLKQLNLKWLEIGVHSEMIPVDESSLIRLYPNLETLCLLLRDKDSEQDLTTFLRHIIKIRREDPSQFSNLKHINIIGAKTEVGDKVNETLWELICPGIISKELTLSTLAIDIGRTTSKMVAQSIFKCCQKTLENLDLYQGANKDDDDFTGFPFGVEFTNLKVFRATTGIVSTMDFLRFMPKLTTLHLVDFPKIISLEGQTSFEDLDGFWCMEEVSGDTIQATGSSVRHFLCGYGVDADDILKLGKLMPNLQKVCIPVGGDDQFEHVLNVWPHLTNLCMLQRENSVFDLGAVFKHSRLVKFLQVVPKYLREVIEDETPSQLVPWFYKKTEDEDDD